MVAVLAGIGIDAMCSRGSPFVLAVCALLILIGGVDMAMVSRPNLHYVWMWEVPHGPPPINFAQYQRDPAIAESSVVRDRRGVVNCYVYTDWPTNAKGSNDQGYLGEQYLLGPGTVTLTRWTPNRLEYAVDAPAASSVMVINQNYDPSWRVMSGQGKTFSQDGLLAVHVPAGKNQIVLRYISMAAIYGMIISMLTALAAFVLIRWESRHPLRADS